MIHKAPLAQLVEALVLETSCCKFESYEEHGRTTQLAMGTVLKTAEVLKPLGVRLSLLPPGFSSPMAETVDSKPTQYRFKSYEKHRVLLAQW